MPWFSPKRCPLPQEDIVSYAFGNCDYDHEKPIYHDLENPERTMSWTQVRSMVRKLVAGIRKAGLQKGDCFSIMSFNDVVLTNQHIMYTACFLGGIGAGGIFSGMNPAYRAQEIRHHSKVAEIRLFIVEPELLESLQQALPDLSKQNIFIFNTRGQRVPSGFRSWEWLLQQGEQDWDRITDIKALKTTEIARLTTSGTTGLPKIAMQSHHNATAFHFMYDQTKERPWESRQLYVLPSFHVASVPAMHLFPLRSGAKAWVMRRFELEAFLAAIEKYHITEIGVAPPLVLAIIMSPLRHKYSLLSIKAIACGAAPLDAKSQRRLQALCAPDCIFTQVWGMTETTSALSCFRYPETDDTGSVGNQFLYNTDVKLIDGDGKDITDFDVRGELCVRGPTVFPGYYNNPKANSESFTEDGFLKTGDIAYCDRISKKWYIVDRTKELIKVRGFQVSPSEIEATLLGHPDIIDCAVIAVRFLENNNEERPRAYIARRPGAVINETEVRKFISENLARYKALTGGVVFVDAIPKSAGGKILRRVLREEAQRELHSHVKL
ncbi:hypothetical protein BGW36DRAFT_436253 [Talaromyces proteolyticus]|uniref:Uncharacterized protein n=1 Tax=Talaromyces proteolyticus TaxID=1131652 RepID=A0AAD4Q6V8_9EURO|nr:uncharacterized protein BGW36DRAFT_436253 [Talaromyces proteolyticus]KAH8706048.1 hypothetical protein BGW36DRAFT_436253 [Talaromyces proteolyticus]